MPLPDLPTYGEAFIHLATAIVFGVIFALAIILPLYLVVGALANKISSLLGKLFQRRAGVAE